MIRLSGSPLKGWLIVSTLQQWAQDLMVVCALAAATLAAGLLVLPSDWTDVPTSDPAVYLDAVQPWQWAVAGVVMVLLSAGSGAAGHAAAPVAGVAVPALAFWCYRAATVGWSGVNLWPIGAFFLALAVVPGVVISAQFGRLLGAKRRVTSGR